MFIYLEDRYSLLNNLPVLKLNYGIGIFNSRGLNKYSYTPVFDNMTLQLSTAFKVNRGNLIRLLELYQVGEIGRRRKVVFNGRRILNNIQINYDGFAYSLPKGLKHLLNMQRIVPIVLIPDNLDHLNHGSNKAFKRLPIVNLKEIIMNMTALSAIEEYYYNNHFFEKTADLLEVEPLGPLIHRTTAIPL